MEQKEPAKCHHLLFFFSLMPSPVIFGTNQTNKKYQRCIWQRRNANLGNEDCVFADLSIPNSACLPHIAPGLRSKPSASEHFSFWNKNEFGSKERFSTKHFSLGSS